MLGSRRGLGDGTLHKLSDWLAGLLPAGPLGQYIAVVGLCGTVTFGYALSHFPFEHIEVLIALWGMCFVLEWAPIKLQGTPLQGISLSVSAAVAFAALLTLGPAASILVNTGSALAYCVKEKRPFYKRFFTSSALLCASGLAGIAFYLAGGQIPFQFDLVSFGAVLLAAGVYFLSSSSLISGAISLASGHSLRAVLSNWQLLFLQVLTTLGIGMVMALAYAPPFGLPGLLFVSVLLVLPWYSTYFYVSKSRQIAEQTEKLQKANRELEAVNRENARLLEQLNEHYLSTIRALAAAVEAKDPYTRGHSEVVRRLALATGRYMQLSPEQLETLSLGALLHDIGKIGIPEPILNKADTLTEDEWVIMHQHPVIGDRILSKVPALAQVSRIVLYHHERVDRRGYPYGISAQDNMLAATVSVCDSYQAMTSDRPYRKAFTHEYALDQIRSGAGTQFVPEVVKAFELAIQAQDSGQLQLYPLEPTIFLRTNSGSQTFDLAQGDFIPAVPVSGRSKNSE